MGIGYNLEYRLPVSDSPLFLHCCPTWLVNTPVAIEMLDIAFWADNSNLSAIYNSSNPIPLALKNGYKSFNAGYNGALDEKYKKESKQKK